MNMICLPRIRDCILICADMVFLGGSGTVSLATYVMRRAAK